MNLPEPAVGAPPAWSPPPPARLSAGDLPMWHRDDPGLPLVSVRIGLPWGSVDDGDAWGLASLVAEMMDESAGDLDSLARAAAVDRLAARLSVDADREWTTVSLDVHRDRLAPALALVADALARPRFVADDFARVRERHLVALEQNLDDNALVAAQAGTLALLGEAHPYGHPVSGTIAAVEAIDLDAVRDGWSRMSAGGAFVVVVGDVREAEAVRVVTGALSGWAARGRPPRAAVPSPRPAGRFLVDVPDASQTVIRLVRPGPTGDAEDRFAVELARIVLGGSFTSRLNHRLREQLGYCYGAHCTVAAWHRAGVLSVSARVQQDATADSFAEAAAVLRKALDEGFTDAEIERARAQALSDLVDRAEGRSGLAETYAGEVEVGRDPVDIGQVAERILSVTPERIAEATRRWIDPDGMTAVAVGDGEKIGPALSALGEWQAIEVG